LGERLPLRYFFEWATDSALWSGDPQLSDQIGYPAKPESLGLSPETCERMRELARWHDTDMDWSDPGGERLWSDEEAQKFARASQDLYHQIVKEIGVRYTIHNEEVSLRNPKERSV
jgi:hypothetical protein